MSKFSCICPSEQKKRDIADKFPCICPSEQKKKDIADKFPCICPEREKKIQPADFHTYVNIQKAMCIKNPATEGGKDILWRIYKKNRFRELFLVGTDSTPTPFVKIQQPLLFWWFYITSALWTGCDNMLKSLWKFETTYKLRYKFLSMVPGQQAIF